MSRHFAMLIGLLGAGMPGIVVSADAQRRQVDLVAEPLRHTAAIEPRGESGGARQQDRP